MTLNQGPWLDLKRETLRPKLLSHQVASTMFRLEHSHVRQMVQLTLTTLQHIILYIAPVFNIFKQVSLR